MKHRAKANIQEAMQYLGCTSRQHVYNLYHAGKIEGFMNGKATGLRIFVDSLLQYIKQQQEKY